MLRTVLRKHLPIVLLVLPVCLFAQTAAAAAVSATVPSRTLSLDEALAVLKSAGNAASPLEFRWDSFLQGGVFFFGNH